MVYILTRLTNMTQYNIYILKQAFNESLEFCNRS